LADLGYIKSLLRQVPDAATRRSLEECFTHVLGNIRFGVPEHQTRATNLQTYFVASTTAASTGEFSIVHGLGSAPHLAIQVLDLSQPGATLVPLEVSRAADGSRVYLKSTSTAAPFWLLLE
jgi:hypothetical protein